MTQGARSIPAADAFGVARFDEHRKWILYPPLAEVPPRWQHANEGGFIKGKMRLVEEHRAVFWVDEGLTVEFIPEPPGVKWGRCDHRGSAIDQS